MAGDRGPNVGEMGTVLRYVARSKLAELVLKPLEDALHAVGYCGYVDVNCIIDDKGQPWPLEFTMRPGWPTFNIQQALNKGDPAEWLGCLAAGRDSRPWRLGTVATGVVMALPEFPYGKTKVENMVGVPILGLTSAILDSVHPCAAMHGNRNRPVHKPVASGSLPDPGEDQGAGLAVLAAGYRSAIEEAATRDPEARVRVEAAVLNAAGDFEALLGMSLAFARQVMEMKLDPEHKNFPKVLSVKQAIAQSMLTATARVRDGLLKPREDDGMDEVLRRIRGEAGEPEAVAPLAPVEDDYDPFS
jgi:hypothetical protein